MDLIKAEMDSDFDAVGFRSQRRNLRVLPQRGTTTVSEDIKRKALLAGKRISKTGKKYWETRKNRSDKKGTNL